MAKSFYTSHSGSKTISPGGQSEQGGAMFQAGFRWSTLNMADGTTWENWAHTISSYQDAGVRIAVGGRVQNFGAPLAGLQTLLELGLLHHCAVVWNAEDEFKTTPPAAFEKVIREFRAAHPYWTREVVLNTVGWLYNAVDYGPLAHRPVLLQVYVADMGITPAQLPQVTEDCISHAMVKGFRDIGVTFQAWGDAEPEWYDYWGSKPRSYFSADVIGAKLAWPQWAVPS